MISGDDHFLGIQRVQQAKCEGRKIKREQHVPKP